ncbi:MAG: HEAT repeat domain-containing protein [Planctomycetota bacterium]|nr:HEAT repeat domain-containing protein [Planctomycetota bacterium]
MRFSYVTILGCVLIVGCLASGCRLASSGLYRRLQDEDPTIRAQAAIEAGKWQDSKAVPYLVDRLTDSEAAVRFFAIISLEKITGQTMEYRYYAPDSERIAAVARWRQWLDRSRGGTATSRPAEGGS